MVLEVESRCCGACPPCSGDFKKVVDLPYSGLVIYVHTRSADQKKAEPTNNEGIIFHNTTSEELSRPKYISELCQYKTKYNHIKIIIKRVRSLLDEIVVIKGNQVIGICEHCKRFNTTRQCKKCNYIVREFLADKNKLVIEDRTQRYKEWIQKVKQLLQSILNAHSVCKHMAYKDTELERILKELKTPLSLRMPDIHMFPDTARDQLMTQSITESNEMLEELLSRIQSEGLSKPIASNDSLYPSPSDYKETCICKLVQEGHYLENEISALSAEKSILSPDADMKTDSEILSKDILHRLLELKRALILEVFKNVDNILVQGMLKTINTVNKHGLLPDSTKTLIAQITLFKKMLITDEKAATRHKDLLDSLIIDLNKLVMMSEGVDKELLKVLAEVCTKTADELAKESDKKMKIRTKQQYKTQQTKQTTQFYPDKESKEGTVSTGSKLEKKPLTKDTTATLLREESKKGGASKKAILKDATSRLIKDGTKEISLDVIKDTVSRTHKGKQKEVTNLPSKSLTGAMTKEAPKAMKEIQPTDKVKEVKKILPKGPTGPLKDAETETMATVHKDKKRDAKEEVLIQKLLELGRALTQGLSQALDKETVRELSGNLKHAITKDTKNVTKDVIETLTDLCKIVTKGLPKKLNKAPVIDHLQDINKIFQQGLTSDQNKESLKIKLQELGKALTQTIPEEVTTASSEFKSKAPTSGGDSAVSKEISKGQHKEVKIKPPTSADESSASRARKKESPTSADESSASKARKIESLASADESFGSKAKKIESPTIEDETSVFKDSAKEKRERKEDLSQYARESHKRVQSDKDKKIQIAKDDSKPAAQNKIPDTVDEKQPKQVKEGKEPRKEVKTKEGKEKTKTTKEKYKQTQSDMMFQKLLKEHKNLKEKELKNKENTKDLNEKMLKTLQGLPGLPEIKQAEPEPSTDTSQSFIEGPVESDGAKYIIIGTTLKTNIPRKGEKEIVPTKPPLYFKNDVVLEDLDQVTGVTFKEFPENKVLNLGHGPGKIVYRLSDREFIDKGWTKLPTKKTMRRMNIYKMKPAYPQYDWFKRNQEKKVMFYDTGEKLADIDDEGRGKWYYKNGTVALEYYNAEDMLVGQRYIVYSSGEECDGGRRRPTTVLALFDYLGNGVVYDYNGNVRLKYNQSEGIIVDPKIGAPSRWKWHTLNEPPVLQQVFVNDRLEVRDPYIEQLGMNDVSRPLDSFTKNAQSDMLQVELDNFVKEKSQKLMQPFKPFRIKMKAAKLNEYFALKILDQSKISLIFRDGKTSLKLNLGMHLNSHEIIDTDISEATEVSTPYDKFPAKTDSVANIQSMLNVIRKSNKIRNQELMNSRISLQ